MKCDHMDNITGRKCERKQGHTHGHYNVHKDGHVWWWYR